MHPNTAIILKNRCEYPARAGSNNQNLWRSYGEYPV